MIESNEIDSHGEKYYDLLSYPINKFKYSRIGEEAVIDQLATCKFPVYLFNYYGTTDYDDIILYLNNLSTKYNMITSEKILLPEKVDIDNFYLQYIK